MSQVKKTVTTVTPVNTIGAPASVTTVVTGTPRKRRRRNRNKRRNRRSTISRSLYTPDFLAYVNTLNDPFDFPPVPLGMGSLMPTRLGTAYLRQQFTLNADGSAQIWINPQAVLLSAASVSAVEGGFFSLSNAAFAAVPTFTVTSAAANIVALNQDFDQARVISCGVRIFPSVPMTAATGWYHMQQFASPANGFPPIGTGAAVTYSTSQLSNMINIYTASARAPVQVVWRPDDAGKLLFDPLKRGASSGANAESPPSLNICFNACQPSATFMAEIVCHIEGYSSATQSDIIKSTVPSIRSRFGFETASGVLDEARQHLKPFFSSLEWDTSVGLSSKRAIVLANYRQYPNRGNDEKQSSSWLSAATVFGH
jgi:hypothetical protein